MYGGGMRFDAAASAAGVLEAVVAEHHAALQHMQPVVLRDTGAATPFNSKAEVAI
jgi:hypothetical protein